MNWSIENMLRDKDGNMHCFFCGKVTIWAASAAGFIPCDDEECRKKNKVPKKK